MSLFARSFCHQAPRIKALWYAHHHLSHRCIATSVSPGGLVDILALRGFVLPRDSPLVVKSPSSYVGDLTIGTQSTLTSIGASMVEGLQSLLQDISTWLIKRTYQPSIIRKRRKHGFRRRKESVGGRRVLKRRIAKGRMRLGGC
mmetsp:Transcript_41879/g.89222  ORF Transcript_41879/g.89222 Transcript_41879/m.89222 type:complete len:144 (-) Transcript_41879:96-527(-)